MMKTMKKFLSGVLTASLLSASFIIPTFAENDISVILNGNTIGFDIPPQIINERTMVPLRAIFEALGASVDWDGDTRTVTSEKDGTTISLTIDSPTMYVNGDAVTLDSPGCIIDGRTLVPVRAISEAYGTEVGWDGDTRTVSINSDKKTEPTPVLTPTATPKPEMYGAIVIGEEYGPMVIDENYPSGKHWFTNNISSLVFTKCEMTNIGEYKVYMNMQGNVDYDSSTVYVYFYDSNNRVLSEELFSHGVSENTDYNVQIWHYIDKDVIDNSARIEFYSFNGSKAKITKATQNTNNNQTDKSPNTTKSTNTHNNTSSTPFERLKNGIINQGIKSSKSESYVIMDQYNGFKLTMIYQEGKSAGFMYQSDGENATQITVIIYEDENQESGVVINTNSFGEERGLIGKYSKTTHKLLKTSSTLYSFEETAVIQLLNTMLGFVDNSLQTKGIDVNLEELGILYDKE